MPELEKTPSRLSLNIPEGSRKELDILVQASGRNITELVRLGLGLVKVFHEETRKGNKIVVASEDGSSVKELVIPGL